jgi:hypothetical protein
MMMWEQLNNRGMGIQLLQLKAVLKLQWQQGKSSISFFILINK